MAYVGGGLGGDNVSAGSSFTVQNSSSPSTSDYRNKVLYYGYKGSYQDYVNQMTAAQKSANNINLPTINGGAAPTTSTGTQQPPVTSTLPTTASATNTVDYQKIADPFASQREQYQNQLSTLMADPSKIADTGAYKWAFDQGKQGVERSLAAKGMGDSGNALTELTKYGQGMASQQFNNLASMLGGFSGAAPGSPAAAAGTIASTENQAQDNEYKKKLLESQNYWQGLNYAKGTGQIPQVNYSIY